MPDRFSQRVPGGILSNHVPAARGPRLTRTDSISSGVRKGATPWRRLQMQRMLASANILTKPP